MSYASNHSFLRALLAVALVLSSSTQPASASTAQTAALSLPKAADLKLDTLLADLNGVIKDASAPTQAHPEKGFAAIDRLQALSQEIAAENDKTQTYFDQLERFLIQKHMPDEILKRHHDFVAAYDAKYRTLTASLNEIYAAHQTATGFWGRLTGANKGVNWPSVLDKTTDFLEANTPAPRKSNFDPKSLPHRNLRAEKPIPPKLTAEEWRQAYPEQYGAGKLARPSAYPAATPLPTPEDLTETIEIRFTPAITQLAAQLEHNPVKIYNWVRNNIEFVPTWGSIQGAQLCLDTKVCNAFDTSSLLIALLRTSGIPARYQMGTIEVPIELAMNWLGGFTDPRSAARFAAGGGIPSTGTVESNGSIKSIRMEHIWVRTYVDYSPSNGSVRSQDDSWVDLDAGFKQYQFVVGNNFGSILALDLANYASHISSTTVTNSLQASVTYFDTQFVDATDQQLIERLTAAYASRDITEDLPRKDITQKDLPILPNTAEYVVLATGPSITSLLPQNRHSFILSLEDSSSDLVLSVSRNLPEIAISTISLYYKPSTEVDMQLIRSAAPPNVQDLHPSQLISTIVKSVPMQLVHVTPVLQVNGVDIAEGSSVTMGSSQKLSARFVAETVDTPIVFIDTIAWGRYGITLDLAGETANLYRKRSSRYQEIAQSFTSLPSVGSLSHFASLTYDLIVQGWFFAVNRHAKLLADATGFVYARYPSLGYSYITGQVTEVFGAPVQLHPTGYIVDVVRQLHIVRSKDGTATGEAAFNIALGSRSSYLEGQVPQQLIRGVIVPNPEGISAGHVIGAASSQNIPVHVLTASSSAILETLDSGQLKESITDKLNAGNIAFVPQSPPLIKGQPRYGYVSIDPFTGDGAYVISNANGGSLEDIFCKDSDNFEKCSKELSIWLDLLWIVVGVALATVVITGAAVGFAILVELLIVYSPLIILAIEMTYKDALVAASFYFKVLDLVKCVLGDIGECFEALVSFLRRRG